MSTAPFRFKIVGPNLVEVRRLGYATVRFTEAELRMALAMGRIPGTDVPEAFRWALSMAEASK